MENMVKFLDYRRHNKKDLISWAALASSEY